jgi:alkaline phosphatase isozyme conversion protein
MVYLMKNPGGRSLISSDRFIKSCKYISIALLLTILMITGCNDVTGEAPETTIGNEGVVIARAIANRFPARSPGSSAETATGDLIISELEKIGFEPVVEEFSIGESTSRNISVYIKGMGFSEDIESDVASDDYESNIIHRKAIIGAHYDTPISVDDLEEMSGYDGLHSNASGVGALLSVAKSIKSKSYGYDIEIIFFGAGNLDFAGSAYYVDSLNESDIEEIDVMYCVDSIFAGDKLYAHAGINSIESGKKYIRRRKLYELSDVAIANRIDLRFNESDLDVDVDGDGTDDVYREITTNKSDHSAFDAVGISCVLIESYEYFASAYADQIESKNPFFGETGGMIRGTVYDSSEYLDEVIEEGRLEKRIKDVAFLIVNALEKGIYR